MDRPMTAFPRSPSRSEAPSGTAPASLASGIKRIDRPWRLAMKAPSVTRVRCAIYTRVSTDHGLDQEFNSLDAQYDAASSYIKSQAHAGWNLIRSRYDDGGYSGGSTDRPDLQKLLEDIRPPTIAVIV